MAHQYLMEGTWPVWQFTVATLDRQDLDAEELIRSLPRVGSTGHVGPSYGLTSHSGLHITDDDRPALTIAAALHVPELRSYVSDPFLRVLQTLIVVQRSAPVSTQEAVKARFTIADIERELPDLPEGFAARLPDILVLEPATWGGSGGGTPAEGNWWRELRREIRQYREATTLMEYVRITTRLITSQAGAPFLTPAVPIPAPVRQPTPVPHIDEGLITDLGGSAKLDLSNYELRWPTPLFVSEGERVLRSSNTSWEEQAVWLLTEAYAGTTAVADFEDLPSRPAPSDDPWATTTPGWRKRDGMDKRDWLTELVHRASELRRPVDPGPYWPQRQARGLSHDGTTPRDARRDFERLISYFTDNGYLVEVFGEECVDDPSELPDASRVIERRLGIPGLWPLAAATWDEDTFFGLIEVFHDLVSRPRTRRFHSWDSCGWHHSEFHPGPARILYRGKVNELLREAGIDYELAAGGEDLGRLVAVTDDARSALVHLALTDSAPDITTRIRHAVALFRGRDTTVESKRSAIVTLAGVLEERRALLKDKLGRDEGALFEIANRYDLRHREAKQRGDYDEAFLDWIFWWYLGTVELTNRLIASRTTG